jgi:CRISPR-associated exonuclease Cas4
MPMKDGAPGITPEKTFLESFLKEVKGAKPGEKEKPAGKPTPAQVFAGQLDVISASELELYAYCPLNWWLDRKGQKAEGPEVEEGEKEHERSGEKLEIARQDDIEARRSETGVLWFAVVATILATVGLALLPFSYSEPFARMLTVVALIWLLAASYFLYRSETIPQLEEKTNYETLILIFGMVATVLTVMGVTLALIVDPVMARILEVTAVAWLIGASLFFYHSMRKRSSAAAVKRAEGLGEKAQLDYVDDLLADGKKPRMFHSEKYGLRGRPDLILIEEGKHVPVEIKTGRTPRGPLFSHILQLAAYMLLVEEQFEPPKEGLLRYAERDDRIEWSSELRMLVTFKLDEMREKLGSGEVHRNHSRPGKCRGCSRRNGCPERLE